MTAVGSRAVVVGGGFVGLATALHLQKAGKHVILMEAGPTVGGRHSCSNGNAGTFAFYANVPVQRPGLWRDAPGMILSEHGALRVALDPHLLKMLPWGIGALASCAPHEVRKTSLALGNLLTNAEQCYQDVWRYSDIDIDGSMGKYAPNSSTSNDPFAKRSGYILLQKDVHSKNALAAAKLRREGLGSSLKMEALDSWGIKELEPHLAEEARRGGAWWFEDGWFLKNPHSLLTAMKDSFENKGGEIRCGDIGRVETITNGDMKSGSVNVMTTDGTSTAAKTVVIAAGAHSFDLAKQCGDRVPLDTERGYSVQWDSSQNENESEISGANKVSPPLLTRPVCSSEGGFIVTPMSGGLRAAGLVELGGTNAGPVTKRFTQLDCATRALFDTPEKHFTNRNEKNDWLGFRPTLPDALPVLGRSSAYENVFYAFGHQHIGWTLGGVTGKVIAELACGKDPGIDLKPFSPKRFADKFFWKPFSN
ncbi:FAD-binding oxidoreductase [bacterium]|nr:FAD-binding oxidoreductase [bacterium]